MGFAICLLAMLKLMDVEAFAASFRKYDLLSQRWGPWARIYPRVELLVGLGVLLQPQATALAMLVGKAVFVDHLALHCACAGGNSKTPRRCWQAADLSGGLVALASAVGKWHKRPTTWAHAVVVFHCLHTRRHNRALDLC